jgi:hypothetical protein
MAGYSVAQVCVHHGAWFSMPVYTAVYVVHTPCTAVPVTGLPVVFSHERKPMNMNHDHAWMHTDWHASITEVEFAARDHEPGPHPGSCIGDHP